jgi:hypothetical protein
MILGNVVEPTYAVYSRDDIRLLNIRPKKDTRKVKIWLNSFIERGYELRTPDGTEIYIRIF